jgi:hypothetical protein
MAARIIGVADQLVTEIDTAWTQGASDTITREYLPSVSIQELSSLTGRHVYVFPLTYDDQPATRAENEYAYTIVIVIVERYTDAAGAATKAWLDTRVNFVHDTVRDAIDFDGRTLLTIGTRRLWTESIETLVYDVDKLNENNVFWSELTVVMKEVA